MKPNIAIGVTTYNRPEYLRKCLRAINSNAGSLIDAIYVHNDGSDSKFNAEYRRAYTRTPNAIIQDSPINEGVAKSKNALLKAMLADGADYLFLIEDDILVTSEDTITTYIDAAEKSNFQHLSYALHGPANRGFNPESDDVLSYYPHSVGAFCLYTKTSLQDVGLFDENLINAWEHVELTLRLAQAGYTSGAYRFADVKDADQYLAEIPGSIDKSSIRPRPDWHLNIRVGLAYWRDAKPETFNELFGEGQQLHNYAMSILA